MRHLHRGHLEREHSHLHRARIRFTLNMRNNAHNKDVRRSITAVLVHLSLTWHRAQYIARSEGNASNNAKEMKY